MKLFYESIRGGQKWWQTPNREVLLRDGKYWWRKSIENRGVRVADDVCHGPFDTEQEAINNARGGTPQELANRYMIG
jgi:hypothetical protein